MTDASRALLLAGVICCVTQVGCAGPHKAARAIDGGTCGPCLAVSQLQIDAPAKCCEDTNCTAPSPETIGENTDVSYWDLPLNEAIQIALQESEVMRDLGGTILRNPAAVRTVQDPAIAYTDPRFGEEAALSQFDASFAARSYFENNDRVFNNQFLGNSGFLVQDLGDYQFELRKRAATGTQMVVRQSFDYDSNNSVANRFGVPSSSWNAIIGAEVRQPLLQGGGIRFNRSAGPSQQPGVINGVLVSRIRTDVSLADFEVGIRDLVSNVENAYWDLYFAYRDLDAKIGARDRALEAWRFVKNKQINKDLGGEPDKEGQAREQYWRFQAEVLDSLNGRLLEATRTNNGSSGGTFRHIPGVRVAERRLRLAIGLPVTGTRLIRPSDEPPSAPVRYDWETIVEQSLSRRPELRKQRWRVKQREVELLANKNFLLPRLDAVAGYRFRGFGEVLASQSEAQFRSAMDNLLDGEFQEWRLGLEFEVPLGFRQAHAAVRNSQLTLARERALLEEQKRTVLYGLSNAVGDVKRSFQVAQAQFNRLTAAQDQVDAVQLSYEAGRAPLDLVLEAQRRFLDTEIRFQQSRVEYAIALKNLQFEQGTLLDYSNIHLAEGPSVRVAYAQAAKRNRLRSGVIDYICRDSVISRGPEPNGMLGQTVVIDEHLPVEDAIGPLVPPAAETPSGEIGP